MEISVLGAGILVEMVLRGWLERGIKIFCSFVSDDQLRE